MIKRIIKYCKQNDIGIYYRNDVFQVECKGAILFQSSTYTDCLEYLCELFITDKHINN